MIAPETKPKVKLIGEDGNAFHIISRVSLSLKKAGADAEYIVKYQDEVTSGDYDHLLQVTMEYVDAE